MNLSDVPELARLHLAATTQVVNVLKTKDGITHGAIHTVTTVLHSHLIAMMQQAVGEDLSNTDVLSKLFGQAPSEKEPNGL